MKKVVTINAGHCKDDCGEYGSCHNGLRECDITFEVGQEVSKRLATYPEYSAIFVQNDSMEQICKASDDANSDLFISIHCNAAENPAAEGTEVYWYKDSPQNEKPATVFREKICNALGTYDRGKQPLRNYYVLRNTNAPAFLLELFFISNKNDIDKYNTHKDELTVAIVEGIIEYFKQA